MMVEYFIVEEMSTDVLKYFPNKITQNIAYYIIRI